MVYSLNFFPTGYRDEIQPTLLTSITNLVPRFLTESTALNLNCFHSLRYYGNKDSEETRYYSNKESESNFRFKAVDSVKNLGTRLVIWVLKASVVSHPCV